MTATTNTTNTPTATSAAPTAKTVAKKPAAVKTPVVSKTAPKAPTAKAAVAKAAVAKAAVAKAAVSKPAKAPKVTAKVEKTKKVKLVRDSLSIPKDEFEVIAVLKTRAAKLGHSAKKTEIIRAGIKAMAALSDQALLKALQSVPSVKTGRPAKQKNK